MARWRRKRYFRHERRCAVHDWITVRQTAQYWLNTIAGLGGEGGSAKNLGTGRANYRAGEARYDSPEVVRSAAACRPNGARGEPRIGGERRFSQPGTAARRAWEPNTEKTPPSASDQRPISGGGVGRVRVSKMSGRGRWQAGPGPPAALVTGGAVAGNLHTHHANSGPVCRM